MSAEEKQGKWRAWWGQLAWWKRFILIVMILLGLVIILPSPPERRGRLPEETADLKRWPSEPPPGNVHYRDEGPCRYQILWENRRPVFDRHGVTWLCRDDWRMKPGFPLVYENESVLGNKYGDAKYYLVLLAVHPTTPETRRMVLSPWSKEGLSIWEDELWSTAEEIQRRIEEGSSESLEAHKAGARLRDVNLITLYREQVQKGYVLTLRHKKAILESEVKH